MQTKKNQSIPSLIHYIRLYLYLIKKAYLNSHHIPGNLKQKAFNKRFFVILNSNDRLITLSNNDIKRLKQKSYLLNA